MCEKEVHIIQKK